MCWVSITNVGVTADSVIALWGHKQGTNKKQGNFWWALLFCSCPFTPSVNGELFHCYSTTKASQAEGWTKSRYAYKKIKILIAIKK